MVKMEDRYWLDEEANKLFSPDLKPTNKMYLPEKERVVIW